MKTGVRKDTSVPGVALGEDTPGPPPHHSFFENIFQNDMGVLFIRPFKHLRFFLPGDGR